MRSQDRPGMRFARSSHLLGAVLGVFVVYATGAFSAEDTALKIVPRLTGEVDPMSDVKTPSLDRTIVDDVRRMRNYPEQPPIIPHSIEGYQLTLNTNRCLSCHKREFTEGSGAPMISITHFMDRDGQVLSDVTPRRYFCTACHVQQTEARPLVHNLFRDAKDLGATQQ